MDVAMDVAAAAVIVVLVRQLLRLHEAIGARGLAGLVVWLGILALSTAMVYTYGVWVRGRDVKGPGE